METGGLKCYVLMLSRVFPVNHYRAGSETFFKDALDLGIKIHTIRANYDLWAKRVQDINDGKAYLSVRQWSDKPYRSKQVEIKQFFKLGIERISMQLKKHQIKWLVQNSTTPYFLHEVASNDGLEYNEFVDWFFPGFDNGEFEGAILHFTDFRYVDPNKQIQR
ncbi:MAG: hypothetical protein JEY96_16855 [Bacteroidales bacterium]|nr:hypothetical protein [Bacteroidales bacterium]